MGEIDMFLVKTFIILVTSLTGISLLIFTLFQGINWMYDNMFFILLIIMIQFCISYYCILTLPKKIKNRKNK